jgi:hypothetical protein
LISQIQVIIALALEHDGATQFEIFLQQQVHARQRLMNLLLQCLFGALVSILHDLLLLIEV